MRNRSASNEVSQAGCVEKMLLLVVGRHTPTRRTNFQHRRHRCLVCRKLVARVIVIECQPQPFVPNRDAAPKLYHMKTFAGKQKAYFTQDDNDTLAYFAVSLSPTKYEWTVQNIILVKSMHNLPKIANDQHSSTTKNRQTRAASPYALAEFVVREIGVTTGPLLRSATTKPLQRLYQTRPSFFVFASDSLSSP